MSQRLLQFPVRDAETAPPAARPVLEGARKKMGFVPNLLGTLANSPALLEGYTTLAAIFEKASFSPTERQIVLLAASAENVCEYCVAAHSVIAGMQKVDPEVVGALRDGRPIADAKLEALRSFTTEVVNSRGRPGPEAVGRFVEAGYTPAHAFEVVLGVGLKTLSNYADHLAGTPLDAAFASAKWTAGAVEEGAACAPAGQCACS
jgi:AhpD family alkylhydroperoxidase